MRPPPPPVPASRAILAAALAGCTGTIEDAAVAEEEREEREERDDRERGGDEDEDEGEEGKEDENGDEDEDKDEGEPDGCESGGDSDGPGRHEIAFEPSEYLAWIPEAYDARRAWPVLVSLHGDEGDPRNSVVWIWGEGHWAGRQDYLLIMPRVAYGGTMCDAGPGQCWWKEPDRNAGWLDQVLDDVAARWNVDLTRVYLTGLSGGAVMTGWYSLPRQDRIAATAYNLGGPGSFVYRPAPREECRVPARFTTGSADFLRDQTYDLYLRMQKEGHDTEWIELRGLGHDFADPPTEQVERNWEWMSERVLCQGMVCPSTKTNPGGSTARGRAAVAARAFVR